MSAFPAAWYRGHHTPSSPHGPDEWDVECYFGDDPPDDSPGWLPLYRAPEDAVNAETEACAAIADRYAAGVDAAIDDAAIPSIIAQRIRARLLPPAAPESPEANHG